MTAQIENGATLYGDSLDVDADTTNIVVNLVASGGKASQLALNATVAFDSTTDTTLAQIDSGASVTVGAGHVGDSTSPAVLVNADDMTVMVTIAGSVAVSDQTAVGLSGAVNLVGRSTQAVIGTDAATDESAASTLGSFTSGGDVDVDATNGGFVGAFAIAGSKSSNSPAAKSTPNNPGTGGTQGSNGTAQSNSDLASWQTKWGAVLGQLKGNGSLSGNIASTTSSDAGSTGQSKAALGVSGSAGVNLVFDDAGAYVLNTGAVAVQNGAGLSLNAENNTTVLVLAGAVALASSSSGGSATGIAGAAAINILSGGNEAYVNNAESLALGSLAIDSKRNGWIVSVAAGLAGATGDDGVAVAGSAGVNVITYTTDAELQNIANATIAGAASLDADDETNLIAVGGAVGYGGKAGVGVAIGFSYENNTTEAEVSSMTNLSAASLGVDATDGGMIVAATGSAGISKGSGGSGYAGAGTVTVNVTENTVEADITDSSLATTGDVSLNATDGTSLYAFSGAIAVGKTLGSERPSASICSSTTSLQT